MKEILIDRQIIGGLVDGYQRYKISYLPKCILNGKELSEKLIVEHRIEKTPEDEIRFMSIRFSISTQLLDFIGHCIQGYIFFKKQKNELKNHFTEIANLRSVLNHYIEKGFKEAKNGKFV